MTIRKAIDLDEVRAFISTQTPETKIYLGTDSERMNIDGTWYADYMTVVVVHINGKNGCRVFGQVSRERDYDQRKDRPIIRLMNEVQKTSEMYLALADDIQDFEVEIHLDINPDEIHGSSVALQQAVGYIRGTCNIVPMVKPNAFCASFAADRYKLIAS
jgi:predicted RNase H-related nuclease YkuK (DUF458 family)